jgi:hypothetical protein
MSNDENNKDNDFTKVMTSKGAVIVPMANVKA